MNAERQSRERSRGQARNMSGRAARRQQREGGAGQNAHLKAPFIKRNIPTYDLLDEEQLVKIEQAADQILAEIGIEFREDPETVELFRKSGASVTDVTAESWNVKFEPGHVREILKTAPEKFIQHARNPANSVEIGGTSMVMAPSYGSPFVMDLDKGRRYGTIQDFENLVKLAQSSPWLHHSGGTICEPTDLPVNKRHLDMVYAHIRYSDRAFLGSITAPERAEDSIEMARILFGREFVDQNCVIMGNFNSTSPLVWDGVSTRGIRAYAAAGQGSIHLPFLLGGAVTPVTMAGSVAQGLAESMVGCALTQLVRPGAPTILATFLSSMSLRSGSPTFGTPEPALGSLVMGQLARRLKLPLAMRREFQHLETAGCPGHDPIHDVDDVSGPMRANYLLHSAGFLDGLLSMSYEKFILDTDLCGMLHAYLKGIEVNDDTLGLDALREGGPGVHMFGTDHTMRHYQTAYWDTETSDDQPFETWSEQGGQDAMTRANQRWKQLLNTYQAPDLDQGIDDALKDFIARKKESVKDSWY